MAEVSTAPSTVNHPDVFALIQQGKHEELAHLLTTGQHASEVLNQSTLTTVSECQRNEHHMSSFVFACFQN